jgi:hypothetical protein
MSDTTTPLLRPDTLEAVKKALFDALYVDEDLKNAAIEAIAAHEKEQARQGYVVVKPVTVRRENPLPGTFTSMHAEIYTTQMRRQIFGTAHVVDPLIAVQAVLVHLQKLGLPIEVLE